MIIAAAAAALALQLGLAHGATEAPTVLAQYGFPRPPPCGHGWDIGGRDGMCYPNGYLPPQEQAARRGYYRGGGRYPVPCGHGADLDIRDGQCYPNGTVPPQFQQGRQRYYGESYYGGGGYYKQRRPPGRYYYED